MAARKAPESVTHTDVYAFAKIDVVPAEAGGTFEVAGQKPDDLANHDIADKYTILGVTPSEFISRHGGDVFDFNKLVNAFKYICSDFDTVAHMDREYKCVEFASLIIYTVGPESRKVKAKQSDKTWIFRFPYVNPEKQTVGYRMAYVSTYKNEANVYTETYQSVNKLKMSVKHASLLAVMVLNKITDLSMQQPQPIVMFTPLAGAVFSRQDIGDIAKNTGTPVNVIIKEINSSCQAGGQYLEESQLHVAAVASIMSTDKLRGQGKVAEANSIVTKTIKQYLTSKKIMDKDRYEVYIKYATGGIPVGLDAKSLIAIFKNVKENETKEIKAIHAAKLAQQTEMTVDRSRLTGELQVQSLNDYIHLTETQLETEKSLSAVSSGTDERIAAMVQAQVDAQVKVAMAVETERITREVTEKYNEAKKKGEQSQKELNKLKQKSAQGKQTGAEKKDGSEDDKTN